MQLFFRKKMILFFKAITQTCVISVRVRTFCVRCEAVLGACAVKSSGWSVTE